MLENDGIISLFLSFLALICIWFLANLHRDDCECVVVRYHIATLIHSFLCADINKS